MTERKAARPATFLSRGTKTSAAKPMRVLIADDQRDVGATLAGLVAHCNHQVVEVVGSGLEAIQAYARHRPDVVLMDYLMAKLNGATACRNILAKDPFARVILISGVAAAIDAPRSGAFAVLNKPVALGMLEATLKAALESRKKLLANGSDSRP